MWKCWAINLLSTWCPLTSKLVLLHMLMIKLILKHFFTPPPSKQKPASVCWLDRPGLLCVSSNKKSIWSVRIFCHKAAWLKGGREKKMRENSFYDLIGSAYDNSSCIKIILLSFILWLNFFGDTKIYTGTGCVTNVVFSYQWEDQLYYLLPHYFIF